MICDVGLSEYMNTLKSIIGLSCRSLLNWPCGGGVYHGIPPLIRLGHLQGKTQELGVSEYKPFRLAYSLTQNDTFFSYTHRTSRCNVLVPIGVGQFLEEPKSGLFVIEQWDQKLLFPKSCTRSYEYHYLYVDSIRSWVSKQKLWCKKPAGKCLLSRCKALGRTNVNIYSYGGPKMEDPQIIQNWLLPLGRPMVWGTHILGPPYFNVWQWAPIPADNHHCSSKTSQIWGPRAPLVQQSHMHQQWQ